MESEINNTLSVDRDTYMRLRERWIETRDSEIMKTFSFEGNLFYRDYAKYLLEYMEGVLKIEDDLRISNIE